MEKRGKEEESSWNVCRGYLNLPGPRGNICQPRIYTWQADKLADGITDPPCIMQPRRAELFFSRCSGEAANRPVRKASERGTEQSTPAGPALSYIPSTTCGYKRATPRILLSGCSHRDQARSPISASSSHLLPPPAELIVLARCTDYGPSTCSTSAPRNNPGTPRLYCLKRPSHDVPVRICSFFR